MPGDRRQARRHRPTSTTRASSTSPTATGRSPSPRARTSSGSDRRSTAAAKALAPGGRLHHSLRSRVRSTPTERSPGSTSCTCTTPSGRSTATRSSRSGRRRRSSSCPRGSAGRAIPATAWILNDMLHDLVAQPAQVYVVWRIDFVPDDLTDAAGPIKPVHTKWLDVAGNPSIYPVFDALRVGRPERHATRSPIRRRPRTSIRAASSGRAAGQPRLSRSRPELDAEPGRDPDRHRRAPAPRRSRHAAAGHPRRHRPTRSSPPTPTTTSRPERSHGTSRWARRRLPGGCR